MNYIQILWNGFWSFLLFSVMLGLAMILLAKVGLVVKVDLITPIAFTLGGVLAAVFTCIELIKEIAGEPEGVSNG